MDIVASTSTESHNETKEAPTYSSKADIHQSGRRERVEKTLFNTDFFSDSKIQEIECVFGDAAPAYYELIAFQVLKEGGPIRYAAALAMLRRKHIAERAEEFLTYCLDIGLFYKQDNLISSARADREIEALGTKREKWRKKKGGHEDSEEPAERLQEDSKGNPGGIREDSEKEKEGEKDPEPSLKKGKGKRKPVEKREVEPYVFLSDPEISKWTQKLGATFYARCCEKLSGWIESDPIPRKIRNGRNADATFRSWVVNAVAQEEQSTQRTNGPPSALAPNGRSHAFNYNLELIRKAEEAEREQT
jgi:hypothetical protein